MRNGHSAGQIVLGVTGGIGSGKTLFCRFLEQSGAHLIDVDEAGRRVVEIDSDVQKAIREAFGARFFNHDRLMDRRGLARFVFRDPGRLARLNRIVWPAMTRTVIAEIQAWRHTGARGLCVLDAAVLFECGLAGSCDYTVLIAAPESLRIQRVREGRGWGRDEVKQRIARQTPESILADRVNEVVENTGDSVALGKRAHDLRVRLMDG